MATHGEIERLIQGNEKPRQEGSALPVVAAVGLECV